VVVGSVREHPVIQAADLILYQFDVVDDGADLGRPFRQSNGDQAGIGAIPAITAR
jgi:hypothetical protein